MEFQNYTGQTVEDALTQASVMLGVTSDHIEYEVIEKGSTGFLGLGSKDAVIRARVKSADEKVLEDAPVAEKNDIYPKIGKYVSVIGSVRLLDVITEEDISDMIYEKTKELLMEGAD